MTRTPLAIIITICLLQPIWSAPPRQYNDPSLQELMTLLPDLKIFNHCASPQLTPVFELLSNGSILAVVQNEKRNFEEINVYSTSAQIILSRLSVAQDSARRILAQPDWKIQNKSQVVHLRRYFEQILFERWSKNIRDPGENIALDLYIETVFEDLKLMYKSCHLEPLTERELECCSILGDLENSIIDFRLVLLQYLYHKSTFYRDQDLPKIRVQLVKVVALYRTIIFPETPLIIRLNLLIRAAFELLDWCEREYSSKQRYCYTNVQAALAARTYERFKTINKALVEVESQNDSQSFIKLVPKVHEMAYEFFAIQFPKNNFTSILDTSLKSAMDTMCKNEFSGPGMPKLFTYEWVRTLSMHTKLIGVMGRLKMFSPITSLPPSAYWQLLQVKTDLRNWESEIHSWGSPNTTDISRLLSLCFDGIREVNRLKRSMDRLAPVRIDSDLDSDSDTDTV